MAHPIFSPGNAPGYARAALRARPARSSRSIPSTQGLATIFDKDILIFCISQLMRPAEPGENCRSSRWCGSPRTICWWPPTGQTGGINYKRLEQALDRLAGTRIKTNIKTGDEVSTQNFGLIDWYDYNRKGSGFTERLRYLDIKLSDFLYRAIQKAEVLAISRDYFRLAVRSMAHL